ncbi:PPE domain-containing protein [Gordonia desulfuricans]|uniref:PPE domain-containing protein n=1 Tax=Gordonia desulfuricans TaxID=89051 RepID=A0A7K3LSR4_9ACTN|nr:PPE domain-containing protein [Gordonia desulfuricans]NDK91280.1 PPE domain-containing protein [Gordonia desulfuricans]
MTGFTGIIWDARTSARLAADLGAGAGPSPLAESAMAWSVVSAEMGRAAISYGKVLAELGAGWESGAAESVLGQLSALGDWLAEMSANAATAAVLVEQQAAAVTVARLAMPDPAEIALVDGLADLAATAASVVPLVSGAAAHAERAVHDQRVRAARVMEAYEVAAEPVARPWLTPHPAPAGAITAAPPAPGSSSDGSAADTTAAQPVSGLSAAVVVPSVPTIRGAYTPTVPASTVAEPTRVSAPVDSRPPSSPITPPIAPMAPAAAIGATGRDDVRTHPMGAAVTVSAAGVAGDGPATWAEVAVADAPVVEGTHGLDPRYLSETLVLPGDEVTG